jgi:hypothetical protein
MLQKTPLMTHGHMPISAMNCEKFKVLTMKVFHDLQDSQNGKIYSGVFWILMPCTLVSELQKFCSNKVLQIFKAEGANLNIVKACSSKTFVPPT